MNAINTYLVYYNDVWDSCSGSGPANFCSADSYPGALEPTVVRVHLIDTDPTISRKPIRDLNCMRKKWLQVSESTYTGG